MKAVVYTEYGSPDVLRYEDVAKPTPQPNEVLVKIHATGVNAADWRLMRAIPFLVRLQIGLRKPRNPILGADIAGVVEAVGRDVTQFKPGDAVLGDLSAHHFGGFAEYVAAPESALIAKPDSLSFEEAAAMPMASLTALNALRNRGKLQPGQKVLINGASGGVGTFLVQIAKAMGATVTAVCSTSKMEMVRALGADEVLDYTRQDFAQSPQRYDLIVAANGDRSIFEYRRALTPQGIYVMAGGSNRHLIQAIVLGKPLSMLGKQTFTMVIGNPNQADLRAVAALIDAGKVKPVIDCTYPLSETAAAIRYVETGHARGKVVVRVVQ